MLEEEGVGEENFAALNHHLFLPVFAARNKLLQQLVKRHVRLALVPRRLLYDLNLLKLCFVFHLHFA